jgi:hypothetical protein
VPGLADAAFVVDLDVVSTVVRAVVCGEVVMPPPPPPPRIGLLVVVGVEVSDGVLSVPVGS